MSSSGGGVVKAAKAALRREMRAKVKAISREDKAAQSSSVVQKLLEHPFYASARSLSVYLSMDDEIRTLDVLKHALDSGKKCYIPR